MPTVFTFAEKPKASSAHLKLCRYKRLIRRRVKLLTTETTRKFTKKHENKDKIFVFDSNDVQQTIDINSDTAQEQVMTSDCVDVFIQNESSDDQPFDHSYANFNISQSVDVSQDFNEQDEPETANTEDGKTTELEEMTSKQSSLITILKSEYQKAISNCSPFKRLEGDDEQTRFYTGLPSYKIFNFLLDKLQSISPTYNRYGLSAGDQLLLVMIKLRLATSHKDLDKYFSSLD